MSHLDARRLIRVVASCTLLFWAALSAFADSRSPPQRPALDPPAITADEPSGTAPRSRIAAVDVAPYSHGDPTAEEQFMLEIINRARANPSAEGLRLKATTDPDILGAYSFFQVDTAKMVAEFAGYPPRPPLAFNANLIAAARGHSQDMVVNDYQGHTGTMAPAWPIESTPPAIRAGTQLQRTSTRMPKASSTVMRASTRIGVCRLSVTA